MHNIAQIPGNSSYTKPGGNEGPYKGANVRLPETRPSGTKRAKIDFITKLNWPVRKKSIHMHMKVVNMIKVRTNGRRTKASTE